MTGTVEEKETFQNAVSREMGEEIGLIPKEDTNLKIISANKYRNGNSNINFTVYDAYIKSCLPVSEHLHNAIVSKHKDSVDKVGCYIYGTKRDILKFLIGPIYRYSSPDQIIGLVAIKAGDIFKLGL